MKKKLMLLFVLLALWNVKGIAQDVKGPAKGKAVVYITRVSHAGALFNFRLFHNDQYVGKFNARKYIRIECEPGKHLFWAKGENRHFLPAELEADKTYFIEARPRIGAIQTHVYLRPIRQEDQRLIGKIDALIAQQDAEAFEIDYLQDMNQKLDHFIEASLLKYEKSLQPKKVYPTLNAKEFYTK
ncbi:MAG: hypothetical protein ACPGJS_01030 [Flammeovirgaceae bacterium]